MIGWAPPAFGLMPRVKPPLSSYEDWKSGASDRNARILNRIKSSGDDELDKMAFEKTMDETSAGVLLGPFSCLSQLASPDPGLAPRCGIWEQHGEAEDPGVRNIDDLLHGEQNETAGCLMSHRPTDADALVAQVRAVAKKFPGSRLAGWSSDFSKAYKQVPGDPAQIFDLVLAQFDPFKLCLALFIPLSLVFGSKTAPLSFSRYPAALCEVVATLFLLPATHCVDDVIFIETLDAAVEGKVCWDLLMSLCGWLMSSSKDMDPSGCFPVIGVSLDLRPFPFSEPSVLITARRIATLLAILAYVLRVKVLGCGEAASLAGKLGFALCVTFGHILTALSRRRTPRTVFRDKDSGPWERVHIREFPFCTLLEFARSFEDGTL